MGMLGSRVCACWYRVSRGTAGLGGENNVMGEAFCPAKAASKLQRPVKVFPLAESSGFSLGWMEA